MAKVVRTRVHVCTISVLSWLGMELCIQLRRLPSRIREITPSSLLTFLLFCVFGVGSWVAINGVWGELSVLVVSLPECWNLPAVLSVVIQVANVGPIIYTVVKALLTRFSVRQLTIEISAVYVLVTIGLASCVLLAILWDKTAVVGREHSVALIVLTFFLALVDCTSSLVFIPFMKHFPAVYISALYMGEGMSGVLPSVVALSQGFVNDSIDCTDRYVGVENLGIHFSPNIYFVFLAAMTVFCGLAFSAIITLPAVRRQMIPTSMSLGIREKSPIASPTHSGSVKLVEESRNSEDEMTESREVRQRYENGTNIDRSPLLFASSNEVTEAVNRHHSKLPACCSRSGYLRQLLLVVWNNRLLLTCMLILNFVSNGSLTSISAFVFRPYGNTVFTVAINVGILVTPFATLCYVVFSHKSKLLIAVLTSIASILGVFFLVVAILSPNPPLKEHIAGNIIIVSDMCTVGLVFICTASLVFICTHKHIHSTCSNSFPLQICVYAVFSAVVAYAKVSLVVMLHGQGTDRDSALFLVGVVIQLGSFFGAVLFFCLVYYTSLFSS